jgi:hypothetical protein
MRGTTDFNVKGPGDIITGAFLLCSKTRKAKSFEFPAAP